MTKPTVIVRYKWHVLLVLFCTMAACFGDDDDEGGKKHAPIGNNDSPTNPDAPPATPEAPVAPPGEVALKVVKARQVDISSPVQVSVWLANGTGSEALKLIPAQFQVRTEDGILMMPRSASGNPTTDTPNGTPIEYPGSSTQPKKPLLPSWLVIGEDPDSTTGLAAGYAVLLRLEFDLKWHKGQVLTFTDLSSADAAGKHRTAEVALGIEEPAKCSDYPTYLDFDRNNCGACGVSVGMGYCDSGTPVKSLQDDLENCGAKEHACATVAPAGGLTQCVYGKCSGDLAVVVDPDSTDSSCDAVCNKSDLACKDDRHTSNGSLGGLTVTIGTSITYGRCNNHLQDYHAPTEDQPAPTFQCWCTEP